MTYVHLHIKKQRFIFSVHECLTSFNHPPINNYTNNNHHYHFFSIKHSLPLFSPVQRRKAKSGYNGCHTSLPIPFRQTILDQFMCSSNQNIFRHQSVNSNIYSEVKCHNTVRLMLTLQHTNMCQAIVTCDSFHGPNKCDLL